MFRRGRILPESFVLPDHFSAQHYRRPSRYAWFLAKNYVLRRGYADQPAGLWVVDNYTADNYYHWMLEALPRLLHAEQDGVRENTVMFPRYFRRNAYIEFTLGAFPWLRHVRWLGTHTKTRVGRLTFVPRQTAERLTSQIHEVSRRVRELSGAAGSDRRIYFTREGAARRRLQNEAEVVRLVRDHGFVVFQLDPSRPWEQVQAAAGAELILGVHGAQLTNVMFMPSGGRLIELRHPDDEHFFEIYGPFAKSLGHRYTRVDCEPACATTGESLNHADLIVDLDLLREALR